MNINNHNLRILLEDYERAVQNNEEEEYESAPSGEFAEYNQHKLQLEAIEEALFDAIVTLGYSPEQLARILRTNQG